MENFLSAFGVIVFFLWVLALTAGDKSAGERLFGGFAVICSVILAVMSAIHYLI